MPCRTLWTEIQLLARAHALARRSHRILIFVVLVVPGETIPAMGGIQHFFGEPYPTIALIEGFPEQRALQTLG
jgi:hypothetical protein